MSMTPMPVRNLPMVQWDCHGCGDCCRTYAVRVTAAEKARIEAQDWSDVPELATVPRTVWEKRIGDQRLNHQADGACIFLGPDNRCRMHGKYGAASKPAACRIYPFTFAPAGNHWRVGLRLACPSALGNQGQDVSGHGHDLREYGALLEAEQTVAGRDAPPLQAGAALPWSDVLRFVDALKAQLTATDKPIERKLREVLALAAVCRRSVFEKVTGPRLSEFLTIIRATAAEDVPADPRRVAAPGWTARMVFRQVAALYTRKDHGPDRGVLPDRGWAGRFAAGVRFAWGRGRVPGIHGAIPAAATFADAERSGPALDAPAEELLARFYTLKVESLAFFGPSNFHLPFWDGLDTLVLTFPAIVWLTRLIAVQRPFSDALRIAVRTVDDNFGFNPLLGSRKQLWALSMLAARGDLPRLVAWYARNSEFALRIAE
jgi:lysine-N-methylase